MDRNDQFKKCLGAHPSDELRHREPNGGRVSASFHHLTWPPQSLPPLPRGFHLQLFVT